MYEQSIQRGILGERGFFEPIGFFLGAWRLLVFFSWRGSLWYAHTVGSISQYHSCPALWHAYMVGNISRYLSCPSIIAQDYSRQPPKPPENLTCLSHRQAVAPGCSRLFPAAPGCSWFPGENLISLCGSLKSNFSRRYQTPHALLGSPT